MHAFAGIVSSYDGQHLHRADIPRAAPWCRRARLHPMIRALLTRPRIAFAGLLAVGAAALVILLHERSGDPQSAITEVERRLGTIEQSRKRYTYELREANSPKPTDKKRSLYRLSGPKNELLFVEGPTDLNTTELEGIVAELYQSGRKQYVSNDGAWADVQSAWAKLTWSNRQIAEAKALAEFDLKPSDVSTYDWDRRFRKSKDPWQVQEVAAFQAQRALYATGAALLTFVVIVLLLAIFGWLWRAMLDRIRELANAFRGM